MKKIALLVLVLFSAVFLVACGDDDGDTPPTPPPTVTLGTLITSPSVSPITSFGQTLVSHDTDTWNGWAATFPGQVNVWDIAADFDLDDGSDDQFDGALLLQVGAASFPSDQTYGELTFYTPAMSSAQGVMVAAASDGGLTGYSAITGTYSAFLNSTSDSRLQTNLPLTSATGTVTLYWSYGVTIYNGNIPGYQGGFRVVVRNGAGAELEELFATTVDSMGNQIVDLTAYAGQNIVLSFEYRSVTEDWTPHMAIIDNVSVLDSAVSPVEFVTNGTFETGNLNGWTANAPAEVQNMTSGVRTLEGLDVTRSFYTVPDKLWGRWVDVFSNPTATAITKTITYNTNLGNDWAGIIYATPGTNNKSLTSWDGASYDRDIAMVHGLASSVTFTSATQLNYHYPVWPPNGAGSDDVSFTYDITVPAGGSVAIVNFIVMGSYDTGLTAVDTTARATEVDAAAAAIVNNFRTDVQYRHGMTQAQIDAIVNF